MARRSSRPIGPSSIRAAYERHGVRPFYELFGRQYSNPHEPVIERALRAAVANWSPDLSSVLDLACGSGEATLALRLLGADKIHGIDPFTADAYRQRTGAKAERLSFEAIAAGALAGRRYGLIVCSFALHLVATSRLPKLAFQLSEIADALLVLTPHKRPVIKPQWGWRPVGEIVIERVRARYYLSNGTGQAA